MVACTVVLFHRDVVLAAALVAVSDTFFFFFQAEDGIRDDLVTGVQTCALPIFVSSMPAACAVLPAGRMPAGPVTVAYRAVIYHCGIDETITPVDTGHQYEHQHRDRKSVV